MLIQDRAQQILGLKLYEDCNKPAIVCNTVLDCPYPKQYILRMIIKLPFEEYKIPHFLLWAEPLIKEAQKFQSETIRITHPYVYITVRHGLVESTDDDVWHVDGFSTKITHLPEQNYVITSCYPTQWLPQLFFFPKDFNPLVHSVHKFFQKQANEECMEVFKENTLYCIDPYIVHRRPFVPEGTKRTFVRVSFVPIEIADDTNTENPLIQMRKYNRNGLQIRNGLKEY